MPQLVCGRECWVLIGTENLRHIHMRTHVHAQHDIGVCGGGNPVGHGTADVKQAIACLVDGLRMLVMCERAQLFICIAHVGVHVMREYSCVHVHLSPLWVHKSTNVSPGCSHCVHSRQTLLIF